MAKRHFLQQPHKYSSKKHPLAGRLMSEKLDGQRCYWDGGISRGLPKSEVPWANCAKDGRYKVAHVATGLWSRYGNVIHAPSWFLDNLPQFPLDGELWTRRGGFQECRSIISKLVPDSDAWRRVKFIVVDSPTYESIFYDSVINLPNYQKDFYGVMPWVNARKARLSVDNLSPTGAVYTSTWQKLQQVCNNNCGDSVQIIEQKILPVNEMQASAMYDNALSSILALSGEGLVTRDPYAIYLPERVHSCVKHKPYKDAEGTIIGYTTGKETDKGSKLLGLMGAAIVSYNGHKFKVSGFTDLERRLGVVDYSHDDHDATVWAERNPDEILPDDFEATELPRGTVITFKYRELTDIGIPKEASYSRKF